MESKITLSHIKLSSHDNWGPDPSFVFEQYRNLPFAPFNKLEKLGKFCDISNPIGKAAAAANPDNELDFITVENKVVGKTIKDKQPFKRPPVTAKPAHRPEQAAPTQSKNLKIQPRRGGRPGHYPRNQASRTKFQDNANVQSGWTYLLDAAKINFDKMPVANVKVTELGTFGKAPEYDKAWENKANLKKNPPFALPNTISLGSGPRSDKFMLQLIEQDKNTNDITIYTTDVILSAVLTVKNSMFPWDISVVKDGNQIFLEPSENKKANYIDILTVNENSAGDLPEDEKDMLRLCIESTNVNKKFIELATKGTEVKNFTVEGTGSAEVPEKKVYRYRKWTLDNKIHIVVRSEVDAYVKEGENTPFVKVCALNECQPQLDWKQNYETNRGALISAELRNNLCKIGKWLCQAFLTDCNTFKIGFVTKPNPKESKHTVLTVEDMSTTTLSNTINFRLKDSWSIIKTLADMMSRQDDGVFSFIKQAYKQSIKIYQVPDREEEDADA